MMSAGREASSSFRFRWLAVLVAAALVATVVVWTQRDDDGDGGSLADDDPPTALDGTGDASGPLRIRLRQAPDGTGVEVKPVSLVEGRALDDAAIDAILDRLPPFEEQARDRQEFNRPAESIKPPVTGDTIQAAFPPPNPPDGPAPATDDGPLQVLRVQPEGDVDIAPFVAITFDQPMVPLTTLDQLDDADVPVDVSPDVPGRWRWIGTRTLRFEHDNDSFDRLPMATEFTVTIPAGTTSATGGALAEAASFTFTTPPPTVMGLLPQNDSLQLQPVFVATFDQQVDPNAVLGHLRLEADGDQAVRLATDAELAADDDAMAEVRGAIEQTPDGRWIAFRPQDPLPADTPVTITFETGTPSAEGPRTTTEDQAFRGRTFPPLTRTGTSCNFGGSGCRPGEPFVLSYSNPLDPTSIDPADVTVSPDLPGQQVAIIGTEVIVQGASAANTTYTVTVPAALADQRGQTLGSDDTATFDVGDPRPFVRGAQMDMTTLDPLADSATYPLVSAGHEQFRVVALRVEPRYWTTYVDLPRHEETIALPDLPVLFDRTIDTGADDGTTVETLIDLDDAFDGDGNILLYVEPVRTFPKNSEEYWENRPFLQWVQRTTIGIDALRDERSMVVWVTDLRDGAAIPGANVQLGDRTSATGSDGTARIELDAGQVDRIIVEAGDRRAVLGSYRGRWQNYAQTDQVRWFTFDDRGLYRPGETLRLKGWVRRDGQGGEGLRLLGPDAVVDYRVYDGQYAEVATGQTSLNALGGFDLAADLPAGANAGAGFVEFQMPGSEQLGESFFQHQFQIQDFRRPEFEVDIVADSPEPQIVTAPVTVAGIATYLSGGGVANAPVTWTVSQRETTYAPPGWQDFRFGIFTPWWSSPRGFAGDEFFFEGPFPAPDEKVERFDGRTDAAGRHRLQVDFDGEAPDQPRSVSVNAAVEDVNRQSFGATTDLLVHSGARYLGLRSTRAFVREGEPLPIDAVLTDIDGNAVAGQEVTLTAARLVEEYVGDSYEITEVDEETCTLTTADEPGRCEFQPGVGGRYRVSGTVTDQGGGRNRTELEVWVSGGDVVPTRTVEQEQLTLIPAQQEYVVGDTAEILVPAPFASGTALVTIAKDGIIESRSQPFDGASVVIEVPLTDQMVPGITVQVDLVGATTRTTDDGRPADDLPLRPAYATGQVAIDVPPTSRTLDVVATPQDAAVQPGGATTVDVTVTGADGAAVAGADVAVVVVDEAVLSLLGGRTVDPIPAFYPPSGLFLDAEYLRRTLLLGRADALVDGSAILSGTTTTTSGGSDGGDEAMASEGALDSAAGAPAPASAAQSSSGAARASAGQDAPAIDVRTNFDALAVFAPSVTTDAEGRVSVPVELPDNLTRYRVIAVAAAGADRFGSGESSITARLPVQVRPSAPRFANFGDAFELPVVVQNTTDADVEAQVVLETANLSTGPGDARRAGSVVTVPANDRVEVRFPVTTVTAGTARFRATAVAAGGTDAAVVELPVFTPATSESFATYGVIDEGAVSQPLLAPTDVVPAFGGLEVTTSSTAVQALTDAVLYLEEYEYTSADAYASRLIAIAALRDVLEAFDAEQLPPAAEIEATARADIAALVGLQNDDGGWPTWQRGRPTEPYVTVQSAHALLVARDAGYDVPQGAIDRALERLRTIDATFDESWTPPAKQALRAYAIHVRDLAGDATPAEAAGLYAAMKDTADGPPLDALAWLWPVVDDGLAAEIRQQVEDRVVETPSAATFASGYDDGADLLLASDRRTDGIVLDAYLRKAPDSDLVLKIVNGLIANQRQGRWGNVQENSFILLALGRYFETFEDQTPNFVARAWLGDDFIAQHGYEGRSVDSTLTLVPTAALLEGGDGALVLAKEGEGRLYYRLGLRTAPANLQVEPRDEGFVVQREYAAVGDADTVVRQPDGTWRIEAGAEVEVIVTMVADSRRTNMALVDPLPAGLEIVNPALAAAPALPPDFGEEPGLDDLPEFTSFPRVGWFDHQNLRDDRAEAFRGDLPAGTYTYRYIARATTPGTFVVPPSRAEEIYTPEVFGRGASDTVEVVDLR